ncbi:MAG: Phospho-N-acetylmuramoyl-pentapeptide-transferase [Candidatus Dependentiae bacterium ADurb.Bin331]|nr:MAG: Phospho-N-acetylmuramoyl-pentapeptide-transferase [Candidatus Dependentiae bacterium ADurb.Bin331]
MLYYLSMHLKSSSSFWNVMHYVSFRAMAALLTSLLMSFLFGEWFINKSKKLFRAKAREWTPERHKAKDDMPTMGGAFILMVVLFTTFLWAPIGHYEVYLMVFCLLGFGAIGGWDDWLKITKRKGISAQTKFVLQCAVAGCIAILLLWHGFATTISFPFFKSINPDIGLLFIFWAMFLMIGTSNAVNLTDGLDGLAIGSLIPNFATFSLICYLSGHQIISSYLHIPFTGTSELAVVGAALVGASIGFLWYNAYPAQIFMGDIGSLALGGALALMAIMAKQEFLLGIAGGLFVVEALSVMMQVYSYKYRGKRIFKMAPIHHHFELLGWQESKITVRFGIISLILCLLALMTLKIR